MLSYFTFYSVDISPRLWSLWPRLQAVMMDWGIDYWENILVPLDNYISRSTTVFLTSKTPDYQASLYQVWSHRHWYLCCSEHDIVWRKFRYGTFNLSQSSES